MMLALLAGCLSSLVAHTFGQGNFNSTLSLFHHKAYHSSLLIGDYIFIDGGEITRWNGKGSGYQDADDDSGVFESLPDNYTYSIDMGIPWTTDTVKFKQITKGAAPVLNGQGLWPDSSGESFYAYGGQVSLLTGIWQTSVENELWQFTPSSDGASGQWSQATVAPSSNFSTLVRTVQSTYGYGGGFGWSIGGQQNTGTDAIYNFNYTTINVPGMVVFDTASQDWYNLSTNAISYYGTVINGATHYVPSFGPMGLLFMLGGVSLSGRITHLGDAELPRPPFSFENIYMYEPSSQQWLLQTATGDVPQSVQYLCAVGVEGDDSTYEIFVYGGSSASIYGEAAANLSDSVSPGSVYVLSIPSFHWQRQDYTSTSTRVLHTCNLAGNRQMVVVGGRIITADSTEASDPWLAGVGVFDLSEMQWRDSYDPSAAGYVTPQAVKTYLESNGRYPATWSDPTVKSLFMESSPAPSPSSDKTNGSPNTGAIAGGVVGGIIVLAAIAALVYFMLRKRRRTGALSTTSPQYTGLTNTDPEDVGQTTAELGAKPRAYEMEHATKPLELDTGAVPELEGGWQGNEFLAAVRPDGRAAVGR